MIRGRGRRIVIALMTLVAVRVCELIVSADMAAETRDRGMRARKREIRACMGERGRCPRRRRMTDRAVLRKLVRRVGRIGHPVEIALVTLVAVGVRDRVVAGDVAVDTGPRLMRPGQGERRRRMVERRRDPGVLCMTGGTVLRELIRRVRGIHRRVVIALMTLDAGRVDDRVIPADVTGLARLCRMCSLQREARVVVVEGRGPPCGKRMACGAVMAELASRMRGILGRVEVGFVALPAIGIGQIVIAADVARLARLCGVCAQQREIRVRVVEIRRRPAGGRMADTAVMTELTGCMVGLRRPVIVRGMTLKTVGVRQIVIPPDVA